MSHHVAAAAEEQSTTTNEVEPNTQIICSFASQTHQNYALAATLNQELDNLTSKQFTLIERLQC